MAERAVSYTIKYNKRFLDDDRRRWAAKINAAAEYLRGQIVRNLSTPTRTAGPSKPGEFPHADTGHLRKSITIQPATAATLEAHFGTNVVYAAHLARKDREFLIRSYYQHRQKMIDIMKS